VIPGIRATCRMEAAPGRTEDRNWLDASFKTYYRPLARPGRPRWRSRAECDAQFLALDRQMRPLTPDPVTTVAVGDHGAAMPETGWR
jgi:hypothetical protein